MDFVAFPLQIGARGRLARSESPAESILQLLRIMATTPLRGWRRGSMEFGLRDALAVVRSKHDARLSAIKQLNHALHELGIDWVSVENIQAERLADAYRTSYVLTLSYTGKGTETHRMDV